MLAQSTQRTASATILRELMIALLWYGGVSGRGLGIVLRAAVTTTAGGDLRASEQASRE